MNKVKTKMDYLREIIHCECSGAEPHSVSPSQINRKLKAMGINVDPSNISAEMKKMGFPFKKPTIGQIIKKAEAKQQLVQGNLENFHRQVTGGLEEHNKQTAEKPKAEKPKAQKKQKTVKKNSEISKSHTYICIAKIEQGGFEYVW